MDANENKEKEEGFLLIPREWLQAITKTQEKIVSLLEKGNGAGTGECVGDYISEEEAKRQLGRKTTWFWNLRTSGQLPFSKVGKKIFYLRSDIKRLIEKNMKKATGEEKSSLSTAA